MKNALRFSEPPSAIIAAVATATRQKQAAEMPRKAEFRNHLFLCGVSSSASEIYFSFMLLNAVKSGNALCSFMIILLSECILLYPKDIFGVWFVCGLK